MTERRRNERTGTERTNPPLAGLVRHEISVVACDLRGFTGFLEASEPERAIDLLAAYYAAVADVVACSGGYIKDHAGDGVLILVGAPLPRSDHAREALLLASGIRERVGAVLVCHANGNGPVGLGIGVASGTVTFGTIGSGEIRETVVVGTAVHRAARLCALAGPGRILVDERTAGGSGDLRCDLKGLDPLTLRGFSRAIRVYEAWS